MLKIFVLLALSVTLFMLISCSATQSQIEKNNSDSDATLSQPQNTNRSELLYLSGLPGIIMNPEFDTYPVGVDSVKVNWINNHDSEIVHEEYYELYILSTDTWAQVEVITDSPFPSIGYNIPSGESKWYTYRLFSRFGKLESGNYRIYAGFTAGTEIYATYAELSIP